MGIPVLNESCFGCCNIRTGARVTSWLSMIISVITFFILSIIEFLSIEESVHQCYNYREGRSLDGARLFVILAVFIGVNLLLQAVLFVFSIANLYGIHKEKRYFMVPYLIVSLINIVIEIIGCIALVIFERTTSSLPVVGCIIVIGLQVYLFLIVHSFFIELKTARNNRRVAV